MKVDFPAVSICNLNPLPSKEKLKGHDVWRNFVYLEEDFQEPGQGRSGQGRRGL